MGATVKFECWEHIALGCTNIKPSRYEKLVRVGYWEFWTWTLRREVRITMDNMEFDEERAMTLVEESARLFFGDESRDLLLDRDFVKKSLECLKESHNAYLFAMRLNMGLTSLFLLRLCWLATGLGLGVAHPDDIRDYGELAEAHRAKGTLYELYSG